MKHLLTAALLITSLPAFGNNFIFRRETTPHIAGGIGINWNQVQVMTTDVADQKGLFYLEYSVPNRRIGRVNFPNIVATRTCEFRRASGGSIGDYKPKELVEVLRMVWAGGNADFYRHDDHVADYNENPLVHNFDFDRTLASTVSPEALDHLARLCAPPGINRLIIQISFYTQGHCRWKPENWFKPENFPFDFMPPEVVEGTFNVSLLCRR